MDNREANIAGHPPYCTCTECVARKLKEYEKQGIEEPAFPKFYPSQTKTLGISKKEKTMKRFSLGKLLLHLLTIVGLGVVSWLGVKLFVLHELSPVIGSIVFIMTVAGIFWIRSLLNKWRFKNMQPSFKKVFFSLFGICLVLTFAGVEPLAGYKNVLLGIVGGTLLLVIIFSPLIIWFVLYFVVGPVFRIKMR